MKKQHSNLDRARVVSNSFSLSYETNELSLNSLQFSRGIIKNEVDELWFIRLVTSYILELLVTDFLSSIP